MSIPSLTAANILPPTYPLKGTFVEGEGTAQLENGLPSCFVFAGRARFLELFNVDTGFVAAWRGPFDNTPTGMGRGTFLMWDKINFPVLKTSYSGVYKCRTDDRYSHHTYTLSVLGKFTL